MLFRSGRDNLRRGIAPPDSSHPQFNKCPNDIDYQIEADYSGLICPGMPNTAIAMGEKFGRLMRANVTSGEVAFRKAWLQAIVDRVEVDAEVIRIVGDKASLEAAVIGAASSAAPGVRSSVRKWRSQGESNPCFRRERATSWAARRREQRPVRAYTVARRCGSRRQAEPRPLELFP